MSPSHTPASLAAVFPLSSRLAGPRLADGGSDDFPARLAADPDILGQYPYLPELAGLEQAAHVLASAAPDFPDQVLVRTLNPSLTLLEVNWSGLPAFLRDQSIPPRPGHALVLIYLPGPGCEVCVITPEGHDLLAMKLASEGIDSRQAAAEAGVSIGDIDACLAQAAAKGLLLTPVPTIVRTPDFLCDRFPDPGQQRVETFALQWHLTQACDLNCRHCYDRSDRKSMEYPQALRVLDELYDFTRHHHVRAQISFSGGNPLLYPHFFELYQAAADHGFLVAVLGNPTRREVMERMLAIRMPEFYQVSLEGLQPHNDHIRGTGHFQRVLAFLDLLRELGVYSMVMLTLTRANADQLLTLAEMLTGRVDLFTFNRLAMVGQGAALASVAPERFPELLAAYLDASERMPHLALKDNLFNILSLERQRPLFDGCTGFGCGAAFNFMALLPDGEVHACRKFPSPLGNIFHQSLIDIYHGEIAARYRAGSSACMECELRPVCRGCAAVLHGLGLDVFTALDPYCWKQS